MDILLRNFFLLMRSGALNEYVVPEKMSAFKWRRLADVVIAEDVATVASRATKNMQYEQQFNMPHDVRERLHAEAAKAQTQNISPAMSTPGLNKKLSRISGRELRATDYSKETLDLLGILIANCQALLSSGTSTRLVIRLGNYIRIYGGRVNYEKLSNWMRELQIERLAAFLGSILIVNFAFKPEELPFVGKVDKKAAQAMTLCPKQSGKETAKQRNNVSYFRYAPLETTSLLLGRLKNKIDKLSEE